MTLYPGGIVIEECLDSPTYTSVFDDCNGNKCTTHLRVKNCRYEQTAYTMACNWLSTNRKTLNDLQLKAINVSPVAGANCWDIEVDYGPKKVEVDQALDYQFQTTGGTSHMTRSLQTITSQSCVRGLPSYNFNGAIGVNSDNEIEGVDVKCPAFSWTQTQAFPDSLITPRYRQLLAEYSSCVNSTPFAGFDAGTVLFEGVTGGERLQKADEASGKIFWYWKITFSFTAMPNVTNVQIGDATVNKDGWDYLWVLWETITQDDLVVKIPRNVCVERVYRRVNLNAFGLANFPNDGYYVPAPED